MNIKSALISSNFKLITIICIFICVLAIRPSSTLTPVPYNDSRIITLEEILPTHNSTISFSNNLASSASLEVVDSQEITLSHGDTEDIKIDISKSNITNETQVVNTHLPDYLMYKNVHTTNLKDFLKSRNSLLAEEPYFSIILSVSKDFNLNPLVLFAITGQEQSFVPKNNKNAYKIANNPFNVFNSWQKYNTNIEDACTIAARTLSNLSKNKPNNIDALTWINRKYSQDQNWSKAVRSIFKQIENNVSYLK
ncbi:hypothetical protein [Clostridium sp.]|uniref:hypothetical protein n=1 Tax=Clostridium sp. TaxID=1506 RepID=UPI003D6C9733